MYKDAPGTAVIVLQEDSYWYFACTGLAKN